MSTVTAMAAIDGLKAAAAFLDRRIAELERLATLAEVTHGMASADYRYARHSLARAKGARETAGADLRHAQELLARRCDVWFRLDQRPFAERANEWCRNEARQDRFG